MVQCCCFFQNSELVVIYFVKIQGRHFIKYSPRKPKNVKYLKIAAEHEANIHAGEICVC